MRGGGSCGQSRAPFRPGRDNRKLANQKAAGFSSANSSRPERTADHSAPYISGVWPATKPFFAVACYFLAGCLPSVSSQPGSRSIIPTVFLTLRQFPICPILCRYNPTMQAGHDCSGPAATAVCEASRDRLLSRHGNQISVRHVRNAFHLHGRNLTARRSGGNAEWQSL